MLASTQLAAIVVSYSCCLSPPPWVLAPSHWSQSPVFQHKPIVCPFACRDILPIMVFAIHLTPHFSHSRWSEVWQCLCIWCSSCLDFFLLLILCPTLLILHGQFSDILGLTGYPLTPSISHTCSWHTPLSTLSVPAAWKLLTGRTTLHLYLEPATHQILKKSVGSAWNGNFFLEIY